MIRNLASGVILFLAMLVSHGLYALGIGDVQLYSSLGHKLEAEIPLKNDQGLESWEIRVSLGSKTAYERQGIPRSYFDQYIKVSLENTLSGRIIRIRSTEPVKEPFVNFLIHLEWPTGNLTKEVTFLVDPVKMTDDPGARIKAAKASDAGFTEALGAREADLDRVGVQSDADLEAELLGYRSPTEAATTDRAKKTPKVTPLDNKSVRGSQQLADRSHGKPTATAVVGGQAAEKSSDGSQSQASQPKAKARGSTRSRADHSESGYQASTATDRQGDRFTYEVQKNDTLWEIARDTRSDREFTTQQVMLAIQELNPQAFIQGNINRLKRDHILQLPSSEDIARRSRRDAVLEVRRQNQLYDEFRGTAVAQIDATQKDKVAAGSGTVERDELRLLSATSQPGAGSSSGGKPGTASAEVSRQLKLAQEELDRTERENVELQGRLQDMTDQVQTLQRLIALKDERLAELQQQLANAQQAQVTYQETSDNDAAGFDGQLQDDFTDDSQTDFGSVDQGSDDTTVYDSDEDYGTDEASDTFDEDVIQDTDGDVTSEDTDSEPQTPPVTTVSESEPRSLLDDILGGDLMLPVAGGLGLLLLVVLGVWYKRRQSANDEDEVFEEGIDELGLGSQMSMGAVAGLEIEEGGPGIDELIKDATDAMSYGRHEKAQQLLQEALALDEGRVDIHLKLMEVYVALKDEMSFNKEKASVMSMGDAGDIAKAESLAESFKPVDIEDLGDLDLGDLEKDLAGFDKPATTSEPEEDLSSEISLGDLESEMQSEAHLPSEENSLEFDVGDIDLEVPDLIEEDTKHQAQDDEPTLEFDLSSLAASTEAEPVEESELPPTMELPELDEGFSGMGTSEITSDTSDSSNDISLDFDGFDSDLGADIPDLSADSTEGSASTTQEAGISLDFDTSSLDSNRLDDGGLDLGSSLDSASTSANPADIDSMGMDFDLGGISLDASSAEAATDDVSSATDDSISLEVGDLLAADEGGSQQAAADDLSLGSLDADMGDVDFGLGVDEDLNAATAAPAAPEPISAPEVSSPAVSAPAAAPASTPKDSALSVDLDSLDLDGSDDDMSFIGGTDEAETKLDLARAYIDMDDLEGAKDILQEVMEEGNDQQKAQAQELINSIG